MKENYADITSRIEEPPKWYDQNGTPRYADFHPRYCPNIYADEVVLLRIACQYCYRNFHVEMHGDWAHHIKHPKELHYGDPPIHDCIGDTMNCIDLSVVQVWINERLLDGWKRHPELEGPMDEQNNRVEDA